MILFSTKNELIPLYFIKGYVIISKHVKITCLSIEDIDH